MASGGNNPGQVQEMSGTFRVDGKSGLAGGGKLGGEGVCGGGHVTGSVDLGDGPKHFSGAFKEQPGGGICGGGKLDGKGVCGGGHVTADGNIHLKLNEQSAGDRRK